MNPLPSPFHRHPQAGFSMFEILVAIVIFAVGMMALSQYQGSLTRSSAIAAARTNAMHLAEQIIAQSQRDAEEK